MARFIGAIQCGGNPIGAAVMRKPVDDLPSPPEAPPATLFGGLLIPFLGLAMLHGVMALFDAMLA